MPNFDTEKYLKEIPKNSRPNHIGIIMDGNSRWAKQKKLPKIKGHQAGGKAVEKVIDACLLFEIPVLTLYAFSTENWQRPENEVKYLMQLLQKYSKEYLPTIQKKEVCFKVLGDLSAIKPTLRANLLDIMEKTKHKKKMTLCLAINYGGRDEIIRASKQIAKDFTAKKLNLNNLDEKKFSSYLDTANLAETDLIIRTSGEQRISNFLLWQSAYAEFHFTKTLWPDFKLRDLYLALLSFAQRKRTKGIRK